MLDSRFGLRKNHSCQTALITLPEEIYNAIQTGNLFGLLQLDLSKAFDLVNHTLQLEKLKLVMLIQSVGFNHILKTGHNEYLLRAHYHNHRQSTPGYHKGRF